MLPYRCLQLLKIVVTFHLVALTWIFFRAQSLTDAWTMLQGLCGGVSGPDTVFAQPSNILMLVLAAATLVLLVDLPQCLTGDQCAALRLRWAFRAPLMALLGIWIVLSQGASDVAFLYFQF